MTLWQVRAHRGQEDQEERQVRNEADSRHDHVYALLNRHCVSVHELASRADRKTQATPPRERLRIHAPASSAARGPLVHCLKSTATNPTRRSAAAGKHTGKLIPEHTPTRKPTGRENLYEKKISEGRWSEKLWEHF